MDLRDSARHTSIFLASGFSCSQAFSQPARKPLTQTVRRTGYQGGLFYNEIPDSKITSLDGLLSLLLPVSNDYQFQLTSKELSEFALASPTNMLTIVDPVYFDTSRFIQFKNIPINPGELASTQYVHGQENVSIDLPSGAKFYPDENKVLDIDDYISSVYLPLVRR